MFHSHAKGVHHKRSRHHAQCAHHVTQGTHHSKKLPIISSNKKAPLRVLELTCSRRCENTFSPSCGLAKLYLVVCLALRAKNSHPGSFSRAYGMRPPFQIPSNYQLQQKSTLTGAFLLELIVGFEPMTSSLPMTCSAS